jgi:hypothetical protein
MYKFRILFDGNLYCSHRREIKESWAFFSLRSSDNIQSSCLLLKSFSPLENTREREASLDYRRKEINLKLEKSEMIVFILRFSTRRIWKTIKKGNIYPDCNYIVYSSNGQYKSLRDGVYIYRCAWATFVMYSHRFL